MRRSFLRRLHVIDLVGLQRILCQRIRRVDNRRGSVQHGFEHGIELHVGDRSCSAHPRGRHCVTIDFGHAFHYCDELPVSSGKLITRVEGDDDLLVLIRWPVFNA